MKKLALLLLLTALPSALHAQASCQSSGNNSSCSTTVGALQVILNIGTAYQLTLSSTQTDLPAPSVADYNTGYTQATGPSATIRSNAPWALSISALNSTWTASSTQTEPARGNKPASDLMWATSPNGTYTNLSTSPVRVAGGDPTAGTTVQLYYRTLYQWQVDTPGNYALQVVFTISSP